MEVEVVLPYRSSGTTMKKMSESVKNKENDVQSLEIFASTASGVPVMMLNELHSAILVARLLLTL